MMDAKLLDLWLKALRSGRYKQTRVFLKRSDGHCCLGVLCAVAKRAKLVPEGVHIIIKPHEIIYRVGDESNSSQLPTGAFGLPSVTIAAAWQRNDVQRQTFSQIADWIETAVTPAPPQHEG